MKQKILNLVYIIIGNIFIALAVNTLILENHIIVGGTSGIGNVLNHYFNIPVSLSVGCLNVCLFLVGLFFIGKKFAMTTLLSTFLFPIILQFFETHSMFHHYLEDPLLAAILAACLVGVGIGLILKANASTGGVDILAILLNKKFGFPVHIVLNCIDLSILVLQFTFNDTTHVIYGIMIVMITAVVLNKTLTQGTSLVQLTVISDHYEDIKQSILHEFDAGVTLLASEKGFTQENSKLLLSVLPYRKLPAIKAKIHEIDPVAFVIVSHVEEVGGKGFTLEKRNA
ncbi:YitT family protein [Massilimicrobiota timonensis]|uniref:Membrane protein n=1 Tax=Massilimicrobiota timonensis TaxID=1776392 RepID=A0A1Y4T162_9FIRM|nr:YitT family protein [Massilimicrobiota timonensis]OUQ35939.1 membrane protein [Massilimicrobiota timonensis]